MGKFAVERNNAGCLIQVIPLALVILAVVGIVCLWDKPTLGNYANRLVRKNSEVNHGERFLSETWGVDGVLHDTGGNHPADPLPLGRNQMIAPHTNCSLTAVPGDTAGKASRLIEAYQKIIFIEGDFLFV